MQLSNHRVSETPVSMFAPFLTRHPQLYAYAEDGLGPHDIFPGLIIGVSHPNDESKYYIVTNAQRYAAYLAQIEQRNPTALDFARIYLIEGSEQYDENMQRIGVSSYLRSEISDEIFRAIKVIEHKCEIAPLRHSKEF